MEDKSKVLEELNILHRRLLSELDKAIIKLNDYSRQQTEKHLASENQAMQAILKKIKEEL